MELQRAHVQIPVEGGAMDALICRPDAGDGLPAVLVVFDIFGLRLHYEDIACRLAGQGYVALVPDLFWNTEVPDFTDRSSFMRFRQTMDDRLFLRDLDAADAYLRSQPFVDGEHVGIVGFCMGGYYSLQEAAHNPTFAACVDFYGAPLAGPVSERAPVTSLQAAERLQMPYLGLFGDEDQSIPLGQVRELEGLLQRRNIPFQIKVYPGAGHAFFNDTAPSYRKEAAEDAWKLMLAFFEQYLKD
jgi:carboxymethylenebutenolidase